MGKMKFKLDIKGLNKLMKSAEMRDVLDGLGAQVEARAESMAKDPEAHYSRTIWTGDYTLTSQIRADNPEALHENLRNNTLLKAVN